MISLMVNTPSKQYQVLTGQGLLKKAGNLISQVIKPGKIAIVSDDKVASLYLPVLEKSLDDAEFSTCHFVFPNGEASKNAENYLRLLSFLSENGLSRTDAVIALGGGVTGDLTGFAASTYLRGIGFIQIPTTLLSAVDSSVGGKTAINLSSGKNQAGTFYQPDLVICDTDLLKTLEAQEMSQGFAEIIKYAMIWDQELGERLLNLPFTIESFASSQKLRNETSVSHTINAKLQENNLAALDRIITRCLEIKAEVVSKDEKDTGLRQVLNFGHSFGHGIEKASNYTVSHGQAVAIGMVIMTKAAVKTGLCDSYILDKLLILLNKFGLNHECTYSKEEIISGMYSDKKRDGNKITLVLPLSFGKCRLEKMSLQEAETLLERGLLT